MFGAALANRIGERCRAVDGEAHVFDFDETKAIAAFETQIQACALASDDLTANRFISLEFSNDALFYGFSNQAIGTQGINADPGSSDLYDSQVNSKRRPSFVLGEI
jgi:hypothetical protein